MISTSDMGLFQYKEFERFLPQPKMEGLEGDLLGARQVISLGIDDLLNGKDYLDDMMQYHWENLYEDVFRRLARASIGHSHYLVTRFVPRMRTDNEGFFGRGIVMELLVDCMIAPTKNVVIPEFIYTEVGYERTQLKEWRCGYCKSPNEMKERHCTQCGSARALLIQEM